MELLITRLTRQEAEGARQIIQAGIDSYIASCPACKGTKDGCDSHAKRINIAQRLKSRFQFPSF